MSTIFDKIRYNHKQYSQLTDPAAKQAIEKLAAVLRHIEKEIVNDPVGQIVIDKSGYIYIDGFHPHVATKLTKVLANGE
jgi:hypothetical protein